MTTPSLRLRCSRKRPHWLSDNRISSLWQSRTIHIPLSRLNYVCRVERKKRTSRSVTTSWLSLKIAA